MARAYRQPGIVCAHPESAAPIKATKASKAEIVKRSLLRVACFIGFSIVDRDEFFATQLIEIFRARQLWLAYPTTA